MTRRQKNVPPPIDPLASRSSEVSQRNWPNMTKSRSHSPTAAVEQQERASVKTNSRSQSPVAAEEQLAGPALVSDRRPMGYDWSFSDLTLFQEVDDAHDADSALSIVGSPHFLPFSRIHMLPTAKLCVGSRIRTPCNRQTTNQICEISQRPPLTPYGPLCWSFSRRMAAPTTQ